MAVGSYDYTGSVYIYRKSSNRWIEEQKLAAPSPMNKDFGKTVKVKGNRVAVGDRMYGFDPEGAVFLYEYNKRTQSWNEGVAENIIRNKDCAGRFGVYFELVNDHELMIGCPEDEKWTGSVYYYSRLGYGSPYELKQRITASDGVEGDRFGQTDQFSIDGSIMIVGQYKQTNAKSYVFKRNKDNEWIEYTFIPAPNSDTIYFGDRLSLAGNKAVIASTDNAFMYNLEACLDNDLAIDK